MLNRWIGIVCAVFMLGANATLFMRDILPEWLAGAPPQPDELFGGVNPERRTQIGVFDASGRNVGRSWTVASFQPELLNVTTTTVLYPILLPEEVSVAGVRMDTQLRYRLEDGVLGDLTMRIRGLPAAVVLHGEFIPPDSFSCKWQIGHMPQRTFVLDAEMTRAMGDVLRPFTRLPGLYVGRTWRLQLLDPLTRFVPGLNKQGILADWQYVRVTRTETIQHRGRPVEVFVVEAPRMRAWVAPQGDVLRQEVELPLLGKLTLYAEPFDEDAYQAARQGPTQGHGEPDEE